MAELEGIEIEKILMRKSTMKEGTFIGGVKVFTDGVFSGEMMVVGNDLPKEGKYHVWARKMRSGKGWIIDRWEETWDEISIRDTGGEVVFEVNGHQDKLRMEDGRRIPLFFNPKKYYDPERVFNNIEKKLFYLFLPEGFDIEALREEWVGKCANIYADYKGDIEGKYNKGTMGEGVDVSKLVNKYKK